MMVMQLLLHSESVKTESGFTDPMQQLIIALHFSQDSFGTAANVTGDQALALIVDEVDRKTGKA